MTWVSIVSYSSQARGDERDATSDARIAGDTSLTFQKVEVAVHIGTGHVTGIRHLAQGRRVAKLAVVLTQEAKDIF